MEVAKRSGGRATPVEDYDYFCEGDVDPYLCKVIVALIFKTNNFIVYLDEDLIVEWGFTGAYGDMSSQAGEILNRVQELQAMPKSHLSRDQKEAFGMLIGESVARCLQGGTDAGARDALERAEKFFEARHAEISRWWYLQASVLTALVVAVSAGILWEILNEYFSVDKFILDGVAGAGAGALGALLSVFVSSKSLVSDSASSRNIHNFQGAARILAGTLGAILIALAVKADLFLGRYASAGGEAFLLFMCMCAGWSERLVPNLIERVELGDYDRTIRDKSSPSTQEKD